MTKLSPEITLNQVSISDFSFIRLEIERLELKIEKLEYSNQEMFNLDPKDLDYLDAIKENELILTLEKTRLIKLVERRDCLAKQLGINSLEEGIDSHKEGVIVLENDSEGVYL